MAIFLVTERQVVHYTWAVEADTEAEAEATSMDGVPDDAWSQLKQSDTEAEEFAGELTTLTPMTLLPYTVTYTFDVDDVPVAEDDSQTITVGALSDTAAESAAERILAAQYPDEDVIITGVTEA